MEEDSGGAIRSTRAPCRHLARGEQRGRGWYGDGDGHEVALQRLLERPVAEAPAHAAATRPALRQLLERHRPARRLAHHASIRFPHPRQRAGPMSSASSRKRRKPTFCFGSVAHTKTTSVFARVTAT